MPKDSHYRWIYSGTKRRSHGSLSCFGVFGSCDGVNSGIGVCGALIANLLDIHLGNFLFSNGPTFEHLKYLM